MRCAIFASSPPCGEMQDQFKAIMLSTQLWWEALS